MDTNELKLLAECATPGPWFAEDWSNDNGRELFTIAAHEPEVLREGQSSIWPGGVRHIRVADTEEGDRPLADAQFIAAADPATILALLARVAELEARTVAVPAGWALVPVEPTVAILAPFIKHCCENVAWVKQAWHEALGAPTVPAAPRAPAAPLTPEWEAVAALAAAPAAPAQPDTITLAELWEAADGNPNVTPNKELLLAAMRGAAPPAQPVLETAAKVLGYVTQAVFDELMNSDKSGFGSLNVHVRGAARNLCTVPIYGPPATPTAQPVLAAVGLTEKQRGNIEHAARMLKSELGLHKLADSLRGILNTPPASHTGASQ